MWIKFLCMECKEAGVVFLLVMWEVVVRSCGRAVVRSLRIYLACRHLMHDIIYTWTHLTDPIQDSPVAGYL